MWCFVCYQSQIYAWRVCSQKRVSAIEAFAVEVTVPALSSSLLKLTDRLSVFTKKDLESHIKSSFDANLNNPSRHLFEESMAADLLNQALTSKNLLSLRSKDDIDCKEVSIFTTPEIFQEEQELLNLANSVHVKKNIIRNLVLVSEVDNFLSLFIRSYIIQSEVV
jgi:hypothetical protein